MRIAKLFAAFALIAGFTNLAGAQVTRKGDAYLFRIKLKKGQKIHFNAPFRIEGLSDDAINLKFQLFLRVLSINRKGVAKVQGHFKSDKLNGMALLPDHTSVLSVTPRGQMIGSDTSLTGFAVTYPVSPVRVGASFSAPVPVMTNLGQQTRVSTGNAVFTFQGFTTYHGQRGARLTFVVSGNKAPSGSMIVSVKDGALLKYYTRFNVDMQQGGQPLTVIATFLRS